MTMYKLFFLLIFVLAAVFFRGLLPEKKAVLSIDGHKSGQMEYIIKDGHAYVRADKVSEALSLAYGSDISFHPKWNKVLVVIDPGHGGKDSGTVFDVNRTSQSGSGKTRISEKDLNMLYSMELKKTIEQDPRFEVRLTRETDVFLALPYRNYIAGVVGADFFISMHVNSFGGKLNKECRKSGFEIYSLSDYAVNMNGYETSLDTYRLGKAARKFKENAAKGYELGSYIAARLRMADIPIYGGNEVNLADFAVLRRSKVPSVLLEAGFLCNKDDRVKLESDDYREKISQAVYMAILDYSFNAGILKRESVYDAFFRKIANVKIPRPQGDNTPVIADVNH